jgi:hypothetical protein
VVSVTMSDSVWPSLRGIHFIQCHHGNKRETESPGWEPGQGNGEDQSQAATMQWVLGLYVPWALISYLGPNRGMWS